MMQASAGGQSASARKFTINTSGVHTGQIRVAGLFDTHTLVQMSSMSMGLGHKHVMTSVL